MKTVEGQPNIPLVLLSGLAADARIFVLQKVDDLLRRVFGRVDESMLREIAAADYGQDADEHLKQLHAIKSGKVLAPMRWEPKEVLELIRWSEPEDPTWSPGSTGDRGHWMRLFSCTVLLRAAPNPPTRATSRAKTQRSFSLSIARSNLVKALQNPL